MRNKNRAEIVQVMRKVCEKFVKRKRKEPILGMGDNGAILLSLRWAPRATRRQQTYPGPRFHPLITTLRGAVLAPRGRG